MIIWGNICSFLNKTMTLVVGFQTFYVAATFVTNFWPQTVYLNNDYYKLVSKWNLYTAKKNKC